MQRHEREPPPQSRVLLRRRRSSGFPTRSRSSTCSAGSERTSTYRQLDERMDRVASMLARLGVRPGERVAMLVGNRVEFIEFFFGAMRAGTIPLLLNTRLAAEHARRSDHGCRTARSHRRSRPATSDALSIAARVPVRHRMLLDEQTGRLPRLRDRDGDARARGRAAADCRRRPGVPALHLRLHRPSQGRDHDPPRHAVVRRLQPALLAVGGKLARPRRAAAVPQERAARHGEADAVRRRIVRADAGLRAARLSRGARQVQVHLFARRRRGVHDVPAIPRSAEDARPQRPAQHDHRLGGGDAGAAGAGQPRAAAHQGRGELRPDRRRQPAAPADRRPAGAARQPRRAGARDRAEDDRRQRQRDATTRASC